MHLALIALDGLMFLIFIIVLLFPYRYLSDEGIKECAGSIEKASSSDIIRLALNVSKSLNNYCVFIL